MILSTCVYTVWTGSRICLKTDSKIGLNIAITPSKYTVA